MAISKLCENEYRVFGIPGAGKTTYLTKKVQGAIEKGYRNDLIVASFTKAAAAELAGRDMALNDYQIGTLHAHCYGTLGQPTIAETKIKDFNQAFPQFALSGKTDEKFDQSATDIQHSSKMDELFAQYNLNRNRKVPQEYWTSPVKALAEKWEQWKLETGYLDFTDLIECSLNDSIYPPNRASVGIFDEVQDFTPLQMDLIRHWAKSMKYLMIAGDDDQAIYLFSGATPDTFLDPPIPEERITILDHSYRCPRAIQDYAQRFLEKIRKRQEKPQNPRSDEGAVEALPFNYKMAREIALKTDEERDGKNDIGNPRQVMFLAACSYMLDPIRKELRRRGVPFHNPYRLRRGDWNPLRKTETSVPNRMLAFMNPGGPYMGGYRLWTAHQLMLWTNLIKSTGILQRGAKDKLKKFYDEQTEYNPDSLLDLYMELFLSESLEQAVQLDPVWLRQHTTSEKYKRMEFPMHVYRQQGKDGLEKTPQVVLGTIHSVKGGQADTVFLAPDLSQRSRQEYAKGPGRESYEAIMRQFYVGATRAREKLIVMRPANPVQCVREMIT